MHRFNPKLIFLTGFMGAGKSYTGKLLAEKMGLPFFDMDAYIEGKAGCSIADYFAKHGEDAFRILERKCLRDFAVIGDAVVATGGGTPCFFDNMEWMNAHGVTIYLKTEVKLLVERLAGEKAHRPLIANMDQTALLDFITRKLIERAPYYENASVLVHQDEHSVSRIVEELLENFNNITGH